MRAAIFSFSAHGAELSKRIGSYLSSVGYDTELQTVAKYAEQTGIKPMIPDHNVACSRLFSNCQAIVFVGSVGIAVRTIAPFIKSKLTDPAIISIDERGLFVIPLLAGHIGGANELARHLATAIGATSCVTTATDVNGLFAVDEWAARNKMVLSSLAAAKDFSAALVDNKIAGLYCDPDFKISGPLPRQIECDTELSVGMAVTLDKTLQPFATTVHLLPRIVHLGIGCRRNTPLEIIEALVLPELDKLKLDLRSVAALASIDLKKNEPGLLAFSEKYKIPAHFYTAAELSSVSGEFTPSAFVESVVGISNVCERSAVCDSNGGSLLLRKTSCNGVTLAVAAERLVLNFSKTGLKID